MSKKSYNPFKMWGSYAGLVLATILFYILTQDAIGLTFSNPSSITGLLFFKDLAFIGVWMSIIFYLSLLGGFLLGWGIHILIRKLRK